MPTCKAGRKSNNAVAGLEKERVKGEKEPQKYTLQNLCAGVAQDTHTER